MKSTGIPFLGLSFDHIDLNGAADKVRRAMSDPEFSYVVTPNVDHVVQLHSDNPDREQLWRAYRGASVCLCDSRILALLGRLDHIRLDVVPGSDLLAHLTASALPCGVKVVLVGGDERQRNWLAARWATATVVSLSPPMGLRHNEHARNKVVEFVESENPELVLLTVGTPQSEIIAASLGSRSRVGGVALCVGASLEFLTGAKRRAPRSLQVLRLEWAFRLLSEPRRLWRRYLLTGPRIIAIWWRWHQARSAENG